MKTNNNKSEPTATHTPEPWKAGPVFNKEGRAIFWTDESKPGKWQRRVDEAGIFSEANAARIVACVNLLAGQDLASVAVVSKAELEALREVAEGFAALSVVTCNRCEGSGKCESTDNACHQCGGYGRFVESFVNPEEVEQARAALVKAQGKE